MISQPKAKQLIIGGSAIRTNEAGLVSLTDIYAAADREGLADGKRKPGDWARESGADFIDFVASNLNTRKTGIYKTTRGKGGGTFAHWQIALAYAKYLSPELHMQVNEVYARVKSGDVTLADEIADKATPQQQDWGIPRTLPIKRSGVFQGLKEKLGFHPADSDCIEAAIEDSRTRTGKAERGKGLGNIIEAVSNFNGSALIFSNKGGFLLHNGKESKLNYQSSILGTLIMWSVPTEYNPGL